MANKGFIVSLTVCYLSFGVSSFMLDNMIDFMTGIRKLMFDGKSTTTTTTTTTVPSTSQHIDIFTATRPTSILSCFLCSGLSKDGVCSMQWQCKPGEICVVYNDHHGYNHKCIDKEVCNKASAIVSSGCWKCCDTALCNDRCSSAEDECVDEASCAVLRSTGYDICGDPSVAHHVCRQSCGHCIGDHCVDEVSCAVLQLTGYDICGDPSVAHHECRKSCGHCIH